MSNYFSEICISMILLFIGILISLILIYRLVTRIFYFYKLYVFKEYKKTVYKLMKQRLATKKKKFKIINGHDIDISNVHIYGQNASITNAFDNFFINPRTFLTLLIFQPRTIIVSENFTLFETFDEYSGFYNIIKLQHDLIKNSKHLKWLKPFTKTINNIFNKLKSYRITSATLTELIEETCYDIANVNLIRFKIILNFLTWSFKNFFVILRQNKYNK